MGERSTLGSKTTLRLSLVKVNAPVITFPALSTNVILLPFTLDESIASGKFRLIFAEGFTPVCPLVTLEEIELIVKVGGGVESGDR